MSCYNKTFVHSFFFNSSVAFIMIYRTLLVIATSGPTQAKNLQLKAFPESYLGILETLSCKFRPRIAGQYDAI